MYDGAICIWGSPSAAPGPLNHSSRYLASACGTFHAPLSALLRDVDILILRQQSDRILKIRRRCGGRGERRPVCGLASLRLRGPSLGPDTPGQGAHFYQRCHLYAFGEGPAGRRVDRQAAGRPGAQQGCGSRQPGFVGELKGGKSHPVLRFGSFHSSAASLGVAAWLAAGFFPGASCAVRRPAAQEARGRAGLPRRRESGPSVRSAGACKSNCYAS